MRIELEGDILRELQRSLAEVPRLRMLRVSQDDRYRRFKINEETWTPPYLYRTPEAAERDTAWRDLIIEEYLSLLQKTDSEDLVRDRARLEQLREAIYDSIDVANLSHHLGRRVEP